MSRAVDDDYVRGVESMAAVLRGWPDKTLPVRFGPAEVVIIVDLDAMIDRIAGSAAAVVLLRELAATCRHDTGKDATLFQARVAFEVAGYPYERVELAAILPPGQIVAMGKGGRA